MKRGLIAAAALTLLVASVGMASAQGGGGRGQGRGFGGGMFGGGGLQLLTIKKVQDELKMTQPQIDKVEAKQQEVRDALQSLRQNAGDIRSMSDEDRQKFFAKTQDVQTKAVNDILDAKQQKRFHQLELQRGGVAGAVQRPDVAKELNITDDQKAKIREIQTAQREKTMEIIQGAGGFQNMTDADRTKLQTLQKAAGDKITAVLTDAQKAQWKTMTGEPFEFPPFQPRQRQ